jgi:hypothetical protein
MMAIKLKGEITKQKKIIFILVIKMKELISIGDIKN